MPRLWWARLTSSSLAPGLQCTPLVYYMAVYIRATYRQFYVSSGFPRNLELYLCTSLKTLLCNLCQVKCIADVLQELFS